MMVGMAIIVKQEARPWERCMGCGRAAEEGAPGPFVFVGALAGGFIEKLEPADPWARQVVHDEVQLCATCVQDAFEKLPGREARAQELEAKLAAQKRRTAHVEAIIDNLRSALDRAGLLSVRQDQFPYQEGEQTVHGPGVIEYPGGMLQVGDRVFAPVGDGDRAPGPAPQPTAAGSSAAAAPGSDGAPHPDSVPEVDGDERPDEEAQGSAAGDDGEDELPSTRAGLARVARDLGLTVRAADSADDIRAAIEKKRRQQEAS